MSEKTIHDLKLKQTNPGLQPLIQRYGCYYMSLLGIAQTHAGELLSVTDINRLYNHISNMSGVMNRNCWMGARSEAVVDIAMSVFGLVSETKKLYVVTNINDISSIPGDMNINSTVICEMTPNDTHFSEGDAKGNEIYDPWSHNIRGVFVRLNCYNVRIVG